MARYGWEYAWRISCWSWWVWVVIGSGTCGAIHAADRSVDWDRIFDGEVIVETVKQAGIPGLRAMFAVTAPPERIWTTLLDYDNFPKIFKGIEKINVLERTPSGAQVEYWTDTVFKKLHYILLRRYDEPGRRLSWSQLTGDLKRMEGSWEIRDTPRPGVQLLAYESYVEIQGGPPAVLVRWVVLEKTREMGQRLRSWIEGRPVPE